MSFAPTRLPFPQSVLKRAFAGGLVEQNPSEEPAGILLERIEAERSAAKPKKRRGGEAESEEGRGRLV